MIYPAYLQAVSAGYLDIWSLQRKPPGLTCCFNETLDDPYAQFYARIDHILIHPPQRCKKAEKAGIKTTGDAVRNVTVNGLWPSDHAGLFGWITFRWDR